MQAVPGVPQGTGMNQFLELFKMQFLMKMMNGDGSRQSPLSGLWMMLVLMLWDQFAKSAPAWFALASAYVQRTYFPDQKATLKDLPLMPSIQSPPPQKTVQACIQFERTVDTKAVDPRIEAVMHHVCTLPEVRSLRYNGVEMIPNFKDMIMIDSDIWFEILNPQLNPIVSSSTQGTQGPKQEPILYRLSTYDHDITWLHKFVEQAMDRFEQEKKNKLGSESYYFDHITAVSGPYRNPLSTSTCTFTKSKFQSNRMLNNVYLRQIDELAERVFFFMRRRDWYDAKGIPHTLGIVMYGHPGCGKTSTIKAIANETKRHIFNISLGAIKTKEAIKDLFYNDNVNILQDGKMELLNIPIKQRIYVIEDIDAMESVVVKRSAEDKKKEDERKIKMDAEIEWLKQTQGKDMAQRMVQGKEEKEEDKLDLATLLNVLDGVRETPGRIIILSTNYPERLDEALLRPGRFDMMLEFEKHSIQVLKLHLERHYDAKLTEKQWKRLNTPSLQYKWTPAEVSQILFRRVNNIELAIDDLVKEDPCKLFKFSQLKKGTEPVAPMEGTDLTALLDIQDVIPEPPRVLDELPKSITETSNQDLSLMLVEPVKSSVVVKGDIREILTEEPVPEETLEKLYADADKELEWLDKECNVLETIKAPHREYLKNVRSSIAVWKDSQSPIKHSSMWSIVKGFYTATKEWREVHPVNSKMPSTAATAFTRRDPMEISQLSSSTLTKVKPSAELTLFELATPYTPDSYTEVQFVAAKEALRKVTSLLNYEYSATEQKLASTSMDETMRNALTRYKEYMTTLSKTLQEKDLKHPVRNFLTYKEDLKTFLKAVGMNAAPGYSHHYSESDINRVMADHFKKEYMELRAEEYDGPDYFSGGITLEAEKPSIEQQLAREKWLEAMKGSFREDSVSTSDSTALLNSMMNANDAFFQGFVSPLTFDGLVPMEFSAKLNPTSDEDASASLEAYFKTTE